MEEKKVKKERKPVKRTKKNVIKNPLNYEGLFSSLYILTIKPNNSIFDPVIYLWVRCINCTI